MATRVPRVRTLGPADLAGLGSCADCGFSLSADLGWARSAQQRWGLVGLDFRGSNGAAHVLLGDPDDLPEGHPLADRAIEPGVAVLLAVHMDQQFKGYRAARLLVTALAARLLGRAPALVTAASRGWTSCQAPSQAWLSGVGFRPLEPTEPGGDWLPAGTRLMRLDLSATVRWKAQLDRVASQLRGVRVGWVRPAPETSARR
ncbi:hypothetical protein ACQB6R_14160 [Propionibacteriaceae bacterium G1746]|uniref:hypothetical protein n=1 Tax=Aestuariimicrobium sp. G57 TaxID=3418485 RepID=UPI003C1E893F